MLRIFNIKIQVINPDFANLKGCLFASKHQSMFETIYFNQLFYNPAYILKKELLSIPLFGTYLKKLGMIAIDRSQGIQSLRYVNDQTAEYVENRPVIIFPEGTRKLPGSKPDYKTGFIGIYQHTKRKILPVAVNSGLCWPKRSWILKSGLITIKFLPVINRGLGKKVILNEVKKRIETASNLLLNN